jgi:hypothetical protein
VSTSVYWRRSRAGCWREYLDRRGMKWQVGDICSIVRSFINLCSLQNISRMNKSGRMRWAEHVTCTGRRGIHIVFWWESQMKRQH